jgi:hypothetical protein
MNLRKQITIPLAGQEIHINVDMRVIEIVESIYDTNVDVVATEILTNPRKIKLTQIATIICTMLTVGHYEQLGLKHREVRDEILGAPSGDIGKMVGAIQAACLYCRKYINEEQFDRLNQGLDLEEEEDKKKATATEVQQRTVQTDSGPVEIRA